MYILRQKDTMYSLHSGSSTLRASEPYCTGVLYYTILYWCALLYHTVLVCSTILYCTGVLYYTILYWCALLYHTVLVCSTILYCTGMLYYTILYWCALLYHTVLVCSTIPYCTGVLYYTILYWCALLYYTVLVCSTIPYCTGVLYYTILYWCTLLYYTSVMEGVQIHKHCQMVCDVLTVASVHYQHLHVRVYIYMSTGNYVNDRVKVTNLVVYQRNTLHSCIIIQIHKQVNAHDRVEKGGNYY